MNSKASSIAVLGAGSWGTALALRLANNGLDTRLWGHDPEHIARLAEARCNHEFLPDYKFPSTLQISSSLKDTVSDADHILIVVPSHAFRTMLEQLVPLVRADSGISWATKGLEVGTGKLLHEIANELFGQNRPLAVLSGPTFATEVASGLPTAITIASNQPAFASTLADLLHADTFRAYTSTDMAGVELGGAIKNVLAIAAGIADGLNYGANTRAALITRGLHEMSCLGAAWGGKPETFMGLAGIGDLALTCTDNQSRNRRMGLALAKGADVESAKATIGQAVEGIATASEVHRLAKQHQIEMPICEQTYQVLYKGLDPKQAVINLLMREQKAESGS